MIAGAKALERSLDDSPRNGPRRGRKAALHSYLAKSLHGAINSLAQNVAKSAKMKQNEFLPFFALFASFCSKSLVFDAGAVCGVL